eukprot:5413538-Karenia_brevis.AAC.1
MQVDGPSSNPLQIPPPANSTNPSQPPHSGIVFCPVEGCPRASPASGRGFASHASMRTHLNEHCWRFRLGSVPEEYMRTHRLTSCSYCAGLIHERYHGLCP